MEAPCLNSLSVLSTSDELRYDEEVISFNSVCEHGPVWPPLQLVQTGRLKKSLLPSRWIILSCIRRLLRFCSGFLPVFAQMWAHMWTRTFFLIQHYNQKVTNHIHTCSDSCWPGRARSVPVPTTVPVPPSLPASNIPASYGGKGIHNKLLTLLSQSYFLSLPKIFLIYVRSNFYQLKSKQR